MMEKLENYIWSVVKKLRIQSWFWKMTEHFPGTKTMVTSLYRKQEQEEQLQKIWCKRIGFILIFLLTAFLFLLIPGEEEKEETTICDESTILREDTGKEVSFDFITQVQGEDKKETITLYLDDREFTPEEFLQLDKLCLTYLNEKLKGNNQSLEKVNSSLNFVAEVPQTGIEISWILPENYIREEGSLNYMEIPKEGVKTSVVAQAKWRNWEKEYTFPITIESNNLPQGEWAVYQIKAAILEKVEQQNAQKQIALPTKIGDYSVRYEESEKEKSPPVYLLVFLIIFFFPIIWKKEERKKIEHRQQQLQLDYPEFINKSMLLFNAGLTIRGCFKRLGEEYQRNLQKGGERRYVYEEVLTAYQEMTNGASEAAAMEHFGKRCRQLSYLRYASIINQNMKKGTEGFIALLETEASDAFEKRKELSRQMGETAGTKLLLPMMLMFGIVIAIIIMPAFMAM